MEQEEAWVAAAGRLRRAPPSSSEQTGQGERWRLPLIALVTLAHAGLLYWLQGAVDAGAASPIPAEPLQVMLLQEAPPSPPPPPPPVRPPRRVSVPASAPRAVVPEQPRAVANAVAPFAPAPATDPAIDAPRLYSADGSIAVPDAVLDDLAAVTRPDRVFSYQTRGLLHARHFLQRPPAMVYEPRASTLRGWRRRTCSPRHWSARSRRPR